MERLTADIKATLNGPMSQKEVTPNTGSAPAATWPNSAFLQNRRYAPRLLHFALNGGCGRRNLLGTLDHDGIGCGIGYQLFRRIGSKFRVGAS